MIINTLKGLLRLVAKILFLLITIVVMFLVISRLVAFYQEDSTAGEIAPKEGKLVSIGTQGTKNVYIQVFGEEGAQPLLLVHGTAAWSGLWKETALVLAEKGYRVHALDLAPF